MKMRYPILILAVLICLTSCFGQATDTAKIKKRHLDRLAQSKKRDSLREIFEGTPPFFIISLEINHKKVLIPTNAKFYATDGQKTYQSKTIDQSRHEFENLPDSARFIFESGSMVVSTGFEKKIFYKNGAEIRFGYFNNLLELRKIWEDGKKDEDFDDRVDIGEPYLSIIKDVQIVEAAKQGRIRPIEFVVFTPRVYGDGVIHTFRNVRLKN